MALEERVPWGTSGVLHGTRSRVRFVEQLLPGRVALITGGGSGQGRAAAVLFARHGARIGVIDVNPEGAEETVRLVKDAGGEARAVVADVSVRADADRMVDGVAGAWGRRDVL